MKKIAQLFLIALIASHSLAPAMEQPQGWRARIAAHASSISSYFNSWMQPVSEENREWAKLLAEEWTPSTNQRIPGLIVAGADIDQVSQHGSTMLVRAIFANDLETVKLLLQAGANTEIRGVVGYTALLIAALNGKGSAVRLLLDAGADRTARSNPTQRRPTGETAEDIARHHAYHDIVKMLSQPNRIK